MTMMDFQQLLSAALKLPKRSQVELASALLSGSKGITPASPEPLSGLSEAELRALAESMLAPRHARRLKLLLRMNREKKLTRALKAELDALLEESDQVALLKAKASYALGLRSA